MEGINNGTKSPDGRSDEHADLAGVTTTHPAGLRTPALPTGTDWRQRRRRVQEHLPGRGHRVRGQPLAQPVAPGTRRYLVPESRWVDIDGPVHYVDYGGPAGAPTMVLVHGLLGTHLNWLALAPELTDEYRVIALDLVGHGLTGLAGRSSDVHTNRRVLDRFLGEVVGEPAVLVGSSMGGLISLLQAAEAPETALGLILMAPPLPALPSEIPSPAYAVRNLPLVVPVLGTALLHALQRVQKAEGNVRALLQNTTVEPARVSDEVIQEHVKLEEARLATPGSSASYQAAAQSTVLVMLRPWDYASRITAVAAPVLLIQGEQDTVLPPSCARRVAARTPHWDFESMPGVGHAPMLEVPQVLAGSMKTWAKLRLA